MIRLLPALTLALAACAAPEQAAEPPTRPQAAEAPPALVPAGQERAALARATLAFGLDLYRRLGERERNLFLSPVSVAAAFGLVQPGARGETAEEIARTMRWPLAGERLHAALGDLLRDLALDEEGRRLVIADALWVQQGYRLQPDYVAALGTHYGARASAVDFARRPAEAGAEISAWAQRSTNGRIRNLVGPRDLTPDTRLVLTNAVWFKADWLIAFSPNATHDRAFRVAGGAPVTTRFMRQRTSFRYLEGPGFQAAELPYRGEETAMILFLPRDPQGLPALERALTAERLAGWVDALRGSERRYLDLILPKLRMETRYDLPPTLAAMGMRLAFSRNADFTGITEVERLKLDRAIHQTFLLVDEQGTEAAAATAISVVPVSARPEPVPFHADRPFLFLIRDNRSGAILFIGRIETPPPAPS
ncbi:MAG: serpin family protein [Pseudomonadota bacterium]|nr:serpin family protein [Pseudomonadota bacterium]